MRFSIAQRIRCFRFGSELRDPQLLQLRPRPQVALLLRLLQVVMREHLILLHIDAVEEADAHRIQSLRVALRSLLRLVIQHGSTFIEYLAAKGPAWKIVGGDDARLAGLLLLYGNDRRCWLLGGCCLGGSDCRVSRWGCNCSCSRPNNDRSSATNSNAASRCTSGPD